MRVALSNIPAHRSVRFAPVVAVAGLFLFAAFLAHRAVALAPLDAATPFMPLARLFDLALLAWSLLLAHAAGAAILRLLGLTMGRVEGASFALALGLGAGAYVALALGFVGLYRGPILLGGVILAAVLLRREIGHSLELTRALLNDGVAALRAASAGVPALVILVGLTALATLLAMLAPPHHWDPLSYHLTAPLWFLRGGWIAPVPGVEFSNTPLATELLYGVGLAAGSDIFGQLLHGAYAVIAALGLWALVRRHGSTHVAWLALILFLTTPLVFIWARVANNDLTFACFTLCAVAAALRTTHRAETTTDRRWLALAGVFAGLVLATKYQGVYVVAPLCVVVLLDGWRLRAGAGVGIGRAARGSIGAAIIVGGVAALVAAPWYLKNLILLGNPIYPTVFGGRDVNPIAVSIIADILRNRVLSPRTPLGFLLLPLRAYTTGSYEQPHTILTPLFLLIPASILTAARRRREVWYALLISGGFLIGFAMGVQEVRYLLAIAPLLCIPTAYIINAIWARSRPVALATIILPALLSLVMVVLFVGSDRPLAVILGQETREEYLRTNTAYGASHRALTFLAKQLQPNERAMLMHEAQIFYQPADFAPGTVLQPDHLNLQPMLLAETWGGDPAAMLRAVQAEGYDYILVNEANIRSWQKSDPYGRQTSGKDAFDRLTAQLQPIYQDGPPDRPRITIYRVPQPTAR